jgi:hypothetical protein
MGLERLNYGFLLHVLNEQSENGELNTPGIRSSYDRWWANCIRHEGHRSVIRSLIRKVREESYVFTREAYEETVKTLSGTVPHGETAEEKGSTP